MFLISDIHFKHPAAFKFAPSRIEAVKTHYGLNDNVSDEKLLELFDNMIVEKWNERVKDDDVIYCLGDVFAKGVDEKLLRKLRGQKTLIVGNHDRSFSLYEKLGWNVVLIVNDNNPKRSYLIEEHCGKKIMFSHYPIFHSDEYDREIVQFEKAHLCSLFVEEKCEVNIHGHIHDADTSNQLSINVCVEKTGFAPVKIEELLSR